MGFLEGMIRQAVEVHGGHGRGFLEGTIKRVMDINDMGFSGGHD